MPPKRGATEMEPEPTSENFQDIQTELWKMLPNQSAGAVSNMIHTSKSRKLLAPAVVEAARYLFRTKRMADPVMKMIKDKEEPSLSGLGLAPPQLGPAVVSCQPAPRSGWFRIGIEIKDGTLCVETFKAHGDWHIGTPFEDGWWVAEDGDGMSYESHSTMTSALKTIVPGPVYKDSEYVTTRTRRVFTTRANFVQLGESKECMKLATKRKLIFYVY
jgi:hypothetical protein